MKEKIGNIVITFPTYVAQINDDGRYEVARWDVIKHEYLPLEYANSYEEAKCRAAILNEEDTE